MCSYILKLMFVNMRTGHTEVFEVALLAPQGEEKCYKAVLPHRLYHRVKAHFGEGPFTTAFTLSHGPYLLHGSVKADMEVRIPVSFEEAK